MTTPSTSPRAEGPPDSKMASGCNYGGRRHVPAEGSVMWHTGINDLPDELLLMILSHVAFTDLLDVVPNVCRRWKKLSQDSKLWAGCVPPLLEACTELERLELCEDDDFEMVHSIPREAFTALGKLKNLQELRISIPIRLPPGVAPLAFKLDVTDCRTLGGALFPYLVGLPRLHTLRMENMAFARLQPGVSSILELSGVRCLTFDYSVVAGVPFEKFPEKVVNLRELGVKECQGDPKAVEGLAKQMPGLKIHGVIRPL
ncbi:uncharacterized protein LOC124605265 [Schistocerca americana]|uniref:uncharacterized protein LOC124605265 n=1 Tax=Schistocerca americana TaxID=7009 RepID=UPI001F50068A|nr:uncharacterized protein LOC124605265 [Schistocerca americana]